jgi:Flp pilus assembly pilin Flp
MISGATEQKFCTEGYRQVNRFKKFFQDEIGAELAEYAVGTAILVAIAIVVYQVLGDAVNNKMNQVSSEIDAPPAP